MLSSHAYEEMNKCILQNMKVAQLTLLSKNKYFLMEENVSCKFQSLACKEYHGYLKNIFK